MPEKLSHFKDRYNAVYILFAFAGIINLLSGTFFVTANDYWMYKFRNTSSEEVDSYHRTSLQTRFPSSMTVSQHVGSVFFSFLTVFFGHGIPAELKLHGSLFVTLLLYIISAIFIHVDTDSWQYGFYVLTMFIITLINGMGAVFGLSLYSVISNFPKEFVGPYLNGAGLASIFTALLQIVALATGISTTRSALVYFWLAIALIFLCLLYMYVVERRSDFYKFHKNKKVVVRQEKKVMSFREFFGAFLLIWKSVAILCFHLLTANPTHPDVTSLIVSEGAGQGAWNDVYFVPVATFLLAAVCEYTTRLLTLRYHHLFRFNGTWFVLLSAIRIVIFIPLFFYCNVQPRHHLPVAFPHDYQYILIMMAFALSNGVLLTIAVLLIPKTVPLEKLEDCYQVNIAVASILMASLSFLGFVSVNLI